MTVPPWPSSNGPQRSNCALRLRGGGAAEGGGAVHVLKGGRKMHWGGVLPPVL
jgi:hypothetical protein